MIKKTIKFKDFNGTERSEDLYFHVSKASLVTSSDASYNEILALGRDLQERGKFLEDIKDEIDMADPFSKNTQAVSEAMRLIGRLIDRLVDLSYGTRSDDGLHFIKNETVLADFKNSAVYDAFVEQMLTNQEEMIDFINNLMGSA